MIQASKIIGTGLATTGLIGAGIGIGVVFGVRLGSTEVMCKGTGGVSPAPILLVTMRIVAPTIILGIGESLIYKHSMIIKAILTGIAVLHMDRQVEILMVKATLLKVDWPEPSYHRGILAARESTMTSGCSPEDILKRIAHNQAIINGTKTKSQQPKRIINTSVRTEGLPK